MADSAQSSDQSVLWISIQDVRNGFGHSSGLRNGEHVRVLGSPNSRHCFILGGNKTKILGTRKSVSLDRTSLCTLCAKLTFCQSDS